MLRSRRRAPSTCWRSTPGPGSSPGSSGHGVPFHVHALLPENLGRWRSCLMHLLEPLLIHPQTSNFASCHTCHTTGRLACHHLSFRSIPLSLADSCVSQFDLASPHPGRSSAVPLLRPVIVTSASHHSSIPHRRPLSILDMYVMSK
jgi:hypothetical protein